MCKASPLTLGVPLRSTGKHSTKVNRAFGPARSFFIGNPRGRQLKALYTAPSCPNSRDLGTAEYAGKAPPLTPRVLRTPSVLQESTPPRLTGPLARQGLSFIVNLRGQQLKARLYSSEWSYRASVASLFLARSFAHFFLGGDPPSKSV